MDGEAAPGYALEVGEAQGSETEVIPTGEDGGEVPPRNFCSRASK